MLRAVQSRPEYINVPCVNHKIHNAITDAITGARADYGVKKCFETCKKLVTFINMSTKVQAVMKSSYHGSTKLKQCEPTRFVSYVLVHTNELDRVSLGFLQWSPKQSIVYSLHSSNRNPNLLVLFVFIVFVDGIPPT